MVTGKVNCFFFVVQTPSILNPSKPVGFWILMGPDTISEEGGVEIQVGLVGQKAPFMTGFDHDNPPAWNYLGLASWEPDLLATYTNVRTGAGVFLTFAVGSDVEEGIVASLTTTQQLEGSQSNKCLTLWYYMFGEQVDLL